MKSGLRLAALFAWCVVSVAFANDDSVDRAAQPLHDGLPEVAVVRLREVLAHELPPHVRSVATAKLVEALLAVGSAAEAETLLRDNAAVPFLRAQVLAAQQRWSDALLLYRQAAADPAQHSSARIGEAEALRALDQREEAVRVLADAANDPRWRDVAQLRAAALLLDIGDVNGAARLLERVDPKPPGLRREKRFLRGRIAALQGNRDRAIELFNSVVKSPEGAPHSLIIATLVAVADLHLQKRAADNGVRALEDFIEHHGGDSDLAVLFAKLEQLYQAQRRASRTELARWAADRAEPRQALAQWHLARMELRANNPERAVELFEQLRQARPPFVAIAPAYLEYSRLLMDQRRYDETREVLAIARELKPAGELLARIESAAGEADFRAKHWPEAAAHFAAAIRAGADEQAASFNAALAWMQAGQPERAAELATDSNARGGLLLEEALSAASHNDKRATDLLQQFVKEFPDHPRRAEAWIALAEIAFHSSPARLRDVEDFLQRADNAQPSDAAREKEEYLRIWLADAAPDPGKPTVITLANEFLQKHPQSSAAAAVRMKLAGAYYRRQDFANAQTQFELLAQQQPEGPLAEKALFFGARSALQTMSATAIDRALALLNEVVKRGGELKWAARNEQAAVERRIGKAQDALTLYDEVLNGAARPEEKREALCGKADTLYELGASDPAKYTEARTLYEQLAAEKNVPVHWRNQALVKSAMCLQKLNDRPHALETFYRVIEQEMRPDRPPEFFWFYKAGFGAAQLLEEESKWPSAATVYQKLAQAGGDRSEEARLRLARLRLEHFLWEQ